MNEALQSICEAEVDFEQKLKLMHQKLKAADNQYCASSEKLYKRRQELISGKSTPSAEELTGHVGTEHMTVASKGHKGVPCFWLNALHNQDTLAEMISSRDKLALAYCTSVKVVRSSGDGPPTLEMSFSSNPFFSNNTLRRCLGDEKLGVAPVTTDINWKDTAHTLTVKEVKKGGAKKGKKAGKGKAAVDDVAGSNVRVKPCASFFRFFLPALGHRDHGSPLAQHLHDPAALDGHENEGGEQDVGAAHQDSTKAEQDELIMQLITHEVLPRAAELFMAGPLQSLDSEEDEEGDGYQLVHGAAGLDPSELPGPVQALLAALRHNQAQINALQEERKQLRDEVQQQEVQLRKHLAQQRRELLLPKASSSSVIPRFWLRVLRSADAAALAVSPRDAAVLAYLADVKYSLAAEPGSSISSNKELRGRFELDFLPNLYLSPSTLTLVKEYSFEVTARGEPYLLHSRVTAAPKWSSVELDPTHRKGSNGKRRPASSIFQLFKQGGGKYAFNLSGSEQDVQDEANELETELLMELHGQLLPKAGTFYSQQLAQDGWTDDDSAEGDKAAWQHECAEAESDDTDHQEPDSDDDEGEAAHKAAARRAKQKQQGWRVTKAGVLIGFLALVLLAEVFVFLDMTGLFKGSK